MPTLVDLVNLSPFFQESYFLGTGTLEHFYSADGPRPLHASSVKHDAVSAKPSSTATLWQCQHVRHRDIIVPPEVIGERRV